MQPEYVRIAPLVRRGASAAIASSARRSILPRASSGNSSRKMNCLGILCGDSSRAQRCRISTERQRLIRDDEGNQLLPRRSHDAPMTRASATPGRSIKHPLDFRRVHLEAGHIDRRRHASRQDQPAVLAEIAHVAGQESAVDKAADRVIIAAAANAPGGRAIVRVRRAPRPFPRRRCVPRRCRRRPISTVVSGIGRPTLIGSRHLVGVVVGDAAGFAAAEKRVDLAVRAIAGTRHGRRDRCARPP